MSIKATKVAIGCAKQSVKSYIIAASATVKGNIIRVICEICGKKRVNLFADRRLKKGDAAAVCTATGAKKVLNFVGKLLKM